MELEARWDQIADLDAAIDEVDQAITESGMRGRLTPPPPAPVDGDGNPQDHEPVRTARRTRSGSRATSRGGSRSGWGSCGRD